MSTPESIRLQIDENSNRVKKPKTVMMIVEAVQAILEELNERFCKDDPLDETDVHIIRVYEHFSYTAVVFAVDCKAVKMVIAESKRGMDTLHVITAKGVQK